MNSQWLIVMVAIVFIALSGILGAMYMNSQFILSEESVVIAESPVPIDAPPTALLVIVTQGEGTVVIDPYKQAYAAGDRVTLRAIPLEGHVFGGWKGAVTSDEDTVVIVLDGEKTQVEAVFR